MSMIGILMWGLSAVLVLAGIGLIVHSVRARQLYRPFDIPLFYVKIFWVVLLCTFSPWAIGAYLIWGVFIQDNPLRKREWHIVYAILILLCFWNALPFIHGTKPIQTPMVSVREGDAWVEEGSSSSISPGLNYHAGSIEARSNTNSTSVVGSSGESKLDIRHLAMVLDGDHPLLHQSAMAVLKAFQTDPAVEKIGVYASLEEMPKGETLPGAWIRLSMPNCKETNIGPNLHLEATVTLHAGSRIFQSGNTYSETYSPPELNYDLSMNVQHQSESVAVGDLYALPAQKIGEELAKGIEQFFSTQREKYGLMPDACRIFVPVEEKTVEAPCTMLKELEPVTRGTRLLTDSFAVWQIRDVSDTTATLTQLRDELAETNWQKDSENELGTANAYLRYRKENQRVEAFIERRDEPIGVWVETSAEKPKRNVIVMQSVWTSVEDVKARIREQGLAAWPTDVLLMLKPWIWNDQELRAEIREVLANRNEADVASLLVLADLWKSEKQPGLQWAALKKAEILAQALGKEATETVRREWEEFKKKNPEFNAPMDTVAVLEALGFITLDGKTKEITRSVGLNQAIGFYTILEDGDWELFCAVMVPQTDLKQSIPAKLLMSHSQKNMRSSQTVGGNADGGSNGYRWETTMNPEGVKLAAAAQSIDGKSFELEMRVVGE